MPFLVPKVASNRCFLLWMLAPTSFPLVGSLLREFFSSMSWLVAFIAQELGLATRAHTCSSHPIRSFTWPLCTPQLQHVGDTFLNSVCLSVRPRLPSVYRWQPTQSRHDSSRQLPHHDQTSSRVSSGPLCTCTQTPHHEASSS